MMNKRDNVEFEKCFSLVIITGLVSIFAAILTYIHYFRVLQFPKNAEFFGFLAVCYTIIFVIASTLFLKYIFRLVDFFPIFRSRPEKMAGRWMLVTTALIAAFWAIYWLVAGEVPRSEFLQVHIESWAFPSHHVALNRGWDMLIGVIWPPLLIWCLENQLTKNDKELRNVLSCFWLIFSVFALSLTIRPEMALPSSYFLVPFIIVSTVCFIGWWKVSGFKVGLIFVASFALTSSLPYALILGLPVGLSILGLVWILPLSVLMLYGLIQLLWVICRLVWTIMILIMASAKSFLPHLYHACYKWLMVLEDEKSIKK